VQPKTGPVRSTLLGSIVGHKKFLVELLIHCSLYRGRRNFWCITPNKIGFTYGHENVCWMLQ